MGKIYPHKINTNPQPSVRPYLGVVVFFLCSTFSATAQIPVDSFIHIRTYPEKAHYFEVDKLQQAYIVKKDNTVIRYLADGTEVFRYNDNTRGELAYIDVTDPFNVLLFYPEFQTITSLDRTMNERGTLLIYTSPVINASAIGLARDNNIWIYDQASFMLYKIAPNGTSILSSNNLSAQLDRAPNAQQIVARGNMVYLLSAEQGIFVFDNFTQFHQLLPYTGFEYLQVQEPFVFMSKPGTLQVYNKQRLKDFTPSLPPGAEESKMIRWMGNHCYLLMPDGSLNLYEKIKKGK